MSEKKIKTSVSLEPGLTDELRKRGFSVSKLCNDLLKQVLEKSNTIELK